MPAWPNTLPSLVLKDGCEETLPNVVIRTQMNSGPVKVRRRYTAGVRTFTLPIHLSPSQAATLNDFFVNTLAGGSLSFTWVSPRTNESFTFRFVSPPKYTARGGNNWNTHLDLEVLP